MIGRDVVAEFQHDLRHDDSPPSGSRVGDDAGQRGRRRHRRRAEVDFGFRVAHPPLEVAVRGGQRDLAVAERALVDAEAAAAARIHDDRARFHKVGQDAELEGGLVDPPRRREHDHPDAARHLAPVQDARRHLQIVQAAVGARPDDDLVDPRPCHLAHGLHVVHRVRAGDLRLKRRAVDLDHPVVPGVGIGRRTRRSDR